MILPDVNVLIYAFRADVKEHAVCNAWLTKQIARDVPFGLSPLSLAALVRITTNRRIYPNPSSLAEALAFCDYLRAQPNCRIVEPGPRHWNIFQQLCTDAAIQGGMVTDAWYAALAIEWGCEWVTTDHDFARFPGLTWRAPDMG